MWLSVDPLVEKTMDAYGYVHQNPIRLIDPTGMSAEDCPDCPKAGPLTKDQTQLLNDVNNQSGSILDPRGSATRNDVFDVDLTLDEVVVTGQKSNKTSKSSMASISIPIGAGVLEGTGTGAGIGVSSSVLTLAGVAAITLTLQGDTPRDFIPLYRGVHVGHPDYINALNGMAVPFGLYSGHDSPYAHNMGDYNSIFTSWTYSSAVANYHANKGGPGGVVLYKRFYLSQTFPSPDNFDELEVLVPGVVTRAEVTRPKGPGSKSAF